MHTFELFQSINTNISVYYIVDNVTNIKTSDSIYYTILKYFLRDR